MHAHDDVPEYLGKVCPECGTRHRVIDAVPKRPLALYELGTLRASPGVFFVQELTRMGTDADGVTEDVVLATAESTKILSFHEGLGWVVEGEVAHGEGDDPERVARDVFDSVSGVLSDAMRGAFGGDASGEWSGP